MDSSELLTAIWDTRIVSYMWISGLSFLVCDTISTFPREVAYIWSSRWSFPKALYLFIRYWTLLELILSSLGNIVPVVFSDMTDLSYPNTQRFRKFRRPLSGGSTILIVVINVILGMRLYALYERKLKGNLPLFLDCISSDKINCAVLILLTSLILLEIGVQIYVAYRVWIASVQTAFIVPLHLPVLGCLSDPDLQITIAGWIVAPVVAVIYFLMMAAKVYQSLMRMRKAGIRVRFSPLLRALARDGTLYFLLVVVNLVVGALNCLLATGPYIVLYQPLNAVSFAITGTRLILNLREAAAGASFPSSASTFDTVYFNLHTTLAVGSGE
ncbi:hypothetical protein CVT26_006499 [Gymnopilus dilepis]|uniref:DUF6533 domain-containing protein n=1 Tax=Gymnopilus dilepis TaxID=231916 RepID=A0A409W1C6_9AGAR|nr:hypothetical protein CVT26_006499 [Gymnopilus dilepis]